MPLSSSLVAVGGHVDHDGRVQVWNWRQGKQLFIIPGREGYSVRLALLSDGRLAIAWDDGTFEVGFADESLAAWNASPSYAETAGRVPARALTAIVAAKDGAFVTTNDAGRTHFWRNGQCEAEFSGFSDFCYYGTPLAIVGRRVIGVGADDCSILVME